MRKMLFILFILILFSTVTAQTRTGTIYGNVVDEEGNRLPGVTITLTGSLTAPMPALSSAQGLFRFLSLAPAKDYAIKAELAGFQTITRENIIIAVGANISLTLTMKMGQLTKEVTVIAPTPVVDVKKITTGITVDRNTLQSLPSSRDPWDIINLAPGVVLTLDNVGGINAGMQPYFAGKGGPASPTGTENMGAWAMDGMFITDATAMGASSTYYDYDVLEEMNISVGGSDITVQTAGVQVNLVTRRGGNKLSFGGRFYLVDNKFQAANITDELKAEGVVGTQKFHEFRDYGFNIGLPLLKNKVWFWGSWGVQDIQTFTVYGKKDDSLLSTLAAKFNIQIIPQNRLEIFVQGNKKNKWGRDPTSEKPEGSIQRPFYHFGFPILKIQDEHMFGDNIFISFKWGLSNGGYEMVPVIDPDWQNLAIWDFKDKRWYGSFQAYTATRPSYQTSVQINYFNDNLFSTSHEIKLGFENSDRNQARDLGWQQCFPGNVIVDQNYIDPTIDFDGDGYPDIPKDPNFKRFELFRKAMLDRGTVGQSAYISDTISFGRFNLILGLRYDRQHPNANAFARTTVEKDHPVWKKYVTPQTADLLDRLLPAFDSPAMDGMAADGSKYYWINWSPRLGLTWDVFGDSKTIAKLSFSRFSTYMEIREADRYVAGGGTGFMNFWWIDNGDGIVDYKELYWNYLSNYLGYRTFDDAGNFIGDWNDAAGRFWGAFDYKAPKKTVEPYQSVDKDAQGIKTTEAIFSLEREILPDFGIQISTIFRRYYNYRWNLKYFPETGMFDNQGWYTAWKTPPAYIPGLGDTKEAKNHQYYYASTEQTAYTPYLRLKKRPDYYVNYYGLDIIFTKRLSNKWMLTGSLSLQKEGQHYGEKGFLDPNNIWAFEGTPYDRYLSRWIIKLSGIYQLPYDISFSFVYKGREGFAVPEYFQIVDYTIPNSKSRSQLVYMTKYGSERLPSFHFWSFRIEKMLKLGDTGKIYFVADLFNALNLNTRLDRRDKSHGTYYIYPDPSKNNFVSDKLSFNLTSIMNPRVLRLGIRFQF